ncbi:spore coat protein JB [Alkalithermobacter thermoalcaliphilus JW-YL-7 = DSM 7308]|uniref:Spore coat assembly protein CotJB, domain containing protein n=1 Tax=Alkalithermobacter thermoalcaliphilus JW-YL-7 = DSM 7308 TaxID=1121328 RepID=A0A150FST2_CLOPD|nr:Spore coat assembly protein CotJB, domain containing protein [[Clostridium] paradoxum JW-YL-7 = DSM 7308]SHL18434.1 spore coat protein JB [[Clostridium] paradoxum JW-YL-7 = DSM 7308]
MKKEDLLRKIQEVEFAAVDLNLYLDMYPDNQMALRDYNCLVQELMNLKRLYEMNYGPFSNFGTSFNQYPFSWVNEPWPWETE